MYNVVLLFNFAVFHFLLPFWEFFFIAEKLRDAKEENVKIHATLDQTLSELNSF